MSNSARLLGALSGASPLINAYFTRPVPVWTQTPYAYYIRQGSVANCCTDLSGNGRSCTVVGTPVPVQWGLGCYIDQANYFQNPFGCLFPNVTMISVFRRPALGFISCVAGNWAGADSTNNPGPAGDALLMRNTSVRMILSRNSAGTPPANNPEDVSNCVIPGVDSGEWMIGAGGGYFVNPVVSASWSSADGGKITYVLTSAHGLNVGDGAAVTGTAPAGYSVSVTAGSPGALAGTAGATLVLPQASDPGAYVSGGVVQSVDSYVYKNGVLTRGTPDTQVGPRITQALTNCREGSCPAQGYEAMTAGLTQALVAFFAAPMGPDEMATNCANLATWGAKYNESF